MTSAIIRHAGRRLAWALVVVLGVTTVSFVVSQLLPGDPARLFAGPQASAADVARARAIYGLDRPIVERYARYWARLVHRGPGPVDRKDADHRSCALVAPGLHVDLGFSFHYRKPVVDLLAAKVPRSIELALSAFAVQVAIGVTAGLVAAAKRGSRWDEATIAATLAGVSAPTFLLGLVLQYVFAYRLRLLPYDGYGTTPAEHAASLVLPAATLGLFGAALYARLTRDEVASALVRDWARTARAKGASEARVLVVHALRVALLPLATLAALDLGTMVGGAIVTEQLFRWPGVGQMAVEAALNRDGSAIFGTVLFTSTAVVASSLAVDLLAYALDPRIRDRRP